MAILYRERAIFCHENLDRVNKIINAKRDVKRLAEIAPSFISIDLTWRCNYNCFCCIEECINSENKDLPLEIIDDIFEYCHKRKVRGVMTIGGEPFLHEQGIRRTLEKSIEYQIPLKTVTNGSCLENYIELINEAYKIPGSIIRVSINSNLENYKKHTRSNVDLGDILKNILKITSSKTPVTVSTVVFPEEAKKCGAMPNVDQIEEIIKYCQDVGVIEYLLLPARNPKTKKRYHRSEKDKEKLKEIKEKEFAGIRIEMDDILCLGRIDMRDTNFFPCPMGFLTTLIGPNGKIYKCTDNRGRESMVLGKIKKPGDFEKFWHSEERVKKQIEKKCPNHGCSRYKVNCILECACKAYDEFGINMADYLIQEQKEKKIFI